LPEAIDRCRLEPKDPVAFVEAVVTYHLIIEGYLALGGQRNTLRLWRKIGILPGFVAGFTAVARDESRHIGFGVLALRRRVLENPEMSRVIARKVHHLLEPAVRVVVGPDEKLPFNHITDVPEPMRINALEARDFAIDSLTKRLRASELAEPEVEEVDARMRSLYDQLWAEIRTQPWCGAPGPPLAAGDRRERLAWIGSGAREVDGGRLPGRSVDADGQSLITSGEQELTASSRLQAGTLSFAETERLLQLASLTWPLCAEEVQRRVSGHNRSSIPAE
jgi:hypothetical protein